jgi:hypothetical protein
VFKQWTLTIGLLLAIVLIGIRMVQRALPQPVAPSISFTCAVAVNHQVGEVCIKGASGAAVIIEIDYCDGSQISSPAIRDQVDGEYRWIWQVETSCEGQIRATATASWPGGEQAEGIATFEVAS